MRTALFRMTAAGLFCAGLIAVQDVGAVAAEPVNAPVAVAPTPTPPQPPLVLLQQPQRLVDTRTSSGPITGGLSQCFKIAGVGGIPDDASSVALNVTAVGYGTRGWLTAYPNGQGVPQTSTVNFDTTEYAIANNTIVAIGSAGQVCVSAGTVNNAPGSAQVVLDATGYSPGGTTPLQMLTSPARLLDTRKDSPTPIPDNKPFCFSLVGTGGIPANAAAVVLNVTAVSYSARGWLTAYPSGQGVPTTSTVNFDPSEYAMANGAIMRVGAAGKACVNVGILNGAKGTSHVVVDATGYLLASALTQLTMLPSPQRIADTRASGGAIGSGSSRCFNVGGQAGVPASANSAILNVTAVGYATPGWLTTYPAGQMVPTTSSLNFDTSEYAMANGMIVRLGDGGQVCVNVGTIGGAPGASNVILDVVGYL